MILNGGSYPYVAKWVKRKLLEDNQEERALQFGQEFRCNEAISANKTKRELVPGGFVDNTVLTLRTQDIVAKEIEPRDYINFKGVQYKVAKVDPRPSKLGFGKYEYFIDLTY